MTSDVHVTDAPMEADPEEGGPRAPGRTVAGEPLRRFVWVTLGFLAFAAALVLLAVARAPQLSPVDEPSHADYAYQISHGSIPAKGGLYTAEIRYEWSCHGLGDAPNTHCTADRSFAAGLQNYTFGDPPLYYLTTGLVARALVLLTSHDHAFITLGRCVGVAWLSGAMLVLYLALRRFRVRWQIAAAAGVLLPLCPGVLAASSTMTSDAPAALAGAAALFVLARITVEHRTGWVLPAVVAVLSTATKVLSGMPMLAVAGVAAFMAVAAWRRADRRGAYRLAGVSGAILVGFGLVYFVWARFQAGRGMVDWVNPNKNNSLPLTGSKAGDLLSNLFGMFQHLTNNYYLAPPINGESLSIWATLLGVVLAAAPLLVMAVSRARSWGWSLGVATFVGITAIALAVEYQVYAENHGFFAMAAARYAISFLPWAIACLAVVAARRRLMKSSLVFVGVGAAVLILAEAGLFTLGPALVGTPSVLIG